MAGNVLGDVEKALDDLSALLDQPTIRQAVGKIPSELKSPVIDGLKSILDVIKKALNDLKANLQSIVNLKELFGTINSLMDAAEGLAPGEKDTLDQVKKVVSTLEDVPGLADIDRILGKLDAIVAKLQGL
jgi:ABC-type transporter Mla subunit MlaD